MASAFKRSRKKDIDQFTGQSCADDSSAETERVCIVVRAGVFSGEIVTSRTGTDAVDLIGGHRDADTSAAEKERLIALPAHDRVAGRQSHIRVIAGDLFVTAEILIRDPLFVEMFFYFLFQGETAVIRCKCQHNCISSLFI